MVETIVTALLAAGILWAFAWSVPNSLAQSRLAAYSKSAPFLQIIIYIGGVMLVGYIANTGAASATALILAVIWCSTVIRETYLRATQYTSYASGSDALGADGKSTTTQATPYGPHHGVHYGSIQKPGSPGKNAAALLDTMSTFISTHGVTTEPFTATVAAEQVNAGSESDPRPPLHPSPSNRADLAQLPSLTLSKRPALGKRTIESLQFRERQ